MVDVDRAPLRALGFAAGAARVAVALEDGLAQSSEMEPVVPLGCCFESYLS